MKSFFKLFSISIQGQIYYRTSLFINLFTPIVNLIGQFILWQALYKQQATSIIGGFSQSEMFSYILITFALNNLLSWSSENILSKEIKSGAIVARFIRPAPFLTQYISEMLGTLILQGIVNFAIVILCFSFAGNSLIMPTVQAIAIFTPCIILAILLRIMLIDIFSLICFFSTEHLGITWTRIALFDFFSGALIPVTMFPKLLKTITYVTPFPYMLQVPIAILLGQDIPVSFAAVFVLQVIWLVIFLLAHKLIYSYARKDLSIAGG